MLGEKSVLEARERLRDALKTWLSTFVREFRSRLEKLPEDSQKLVLRGNDFRVPCQIFMFWVLEPQYQYVIIIREPRIPYDVIKIYGPASLATMVSEADTMLNEPWFDSTPEVDPSVEQHYKKIVEEHLSGLVENLPQFATKLPVGEKNEIHVVKRTPEESTYFTWSIFGNLLTQHPLQFAAKTVADSVSRHEMSDTRRQNPESVKTVTTDPSPAPVRPGFLSAFYPPMWLGEPLTFGFRERVQGIYIPPSSMKFSCVYKGREVTILRNGVLTMIEPDLSTCLGLLNEIMCVALFLGIPSSAVRDQDVSEAMFYDNGELGSYSLATSEIRRRSIEKEYNSISEEEFNQFKVVSETDLNQIIDTAEQTIKTAEQANYANWFIDAHSYVKEADYNQSTMKSWLIIESHAKALWRHYEAELGRIPGDQRNLRRLSMKKVLNDLRRGKRITQNEYLKLDGLRNLRNEIVHRGRVATREEAEIFLTLAEDHTRSNLGISKIPGLI